VAVEGGMDGVCLFAGLKALRLKGRCSFPSRRGWGEWEMRRTDKIRDGIHQFKAHYEVHAYSELSDVRSHPLKIPTSAPRIPTMQLQTNQ
jgi:hypothetical protein